MCFDILMFPSLVFPPLRNGGATSVLWMLRKRNGFLQLQPTQLGQPRIHSMFSTSSVGEVATGGKLNPMLLGAGYITVNKKDTSLCLYYKVTHSIIHFYKNLIALKNTLFQFVCLTIRIKYPLQQILKKNGIVRKVPFTCNDLKKYFIII